MNAKVLLNPGGKYSGLSWCRKIAQLAKGCCKTPILQILSVDPVISWSKVARCCFELPALTGNLSTFMAGAPELYPNPC
jgi:hypothetical protein